MAKNTSKSTALATKGPPGLNSLTVLFFEGQVSYLGVASTAEASTLNLSSATARYVEVYPGEWSLCMVLRPRVGKAIKLARPMSADSLRPIDLLETFLAKEIMVQARLEVKRLQEAMDDRAVSRLVAGSDSKGG